jgi:tetratricopeptide (TPR) repeat protein
MAMAFGVPRMAGAQQYVQPKILSRAGTSVGVPGAGEVIIQVQVNADGTHKVQKVIAATNPGDITAALDIAKNSTYLPARRNGKPVTSFYDFTLRFTGKSLGGIAASSGGSNSSGTGANAADAQVARMLHAGNYTGAKARIQTIVQQNPNDSLARTLLGVANYYTGQFNDSAAAFDQVPVIDKQFVPLAAQSYAHAALNLATSNSSQALAYAQKANQLTPNAFTYFSIGTVQLETQNYTDAVASFKRARDLGFADPTTDVKSRANIDGGLLQAYVKAGDMADAQNLTAEIKKLDPTSTVPGEVMANAYLQTGFTALQAKHSDQALAAFNQAAAQGIPEASAVANSQAAFIFANGDKPDYGKVKEYADKAIAADPNNPLANWAEAVSYTGQYASSQSADAKKQAQTYATKASQLARAQGNESLAKQIDSYVQTNLK